MEEDLANKLNISESDIGEDREKGHKIPSVSESVVGLLRGFLDIQQRRALAYSRLKRGFDNYMVLGNALAYQKLCGEITMEFNDCSKEVLKLESTFLSPEFCREDLAGLLRSIQAQEKEKLHSTATLQVLKKAGRPSERLVNHGNCSSGQSTGHECVHIQKITEASGTEEAEADAEYDSAVKDTITGVQNAVIAINEYLEEVRYEIAAFEAE